MYITIMMDFQKLCKCPNLQFHLRMSSRFSSSGGGLVCRVLLCFLITFSCFFHIRAFARLKDIVAFFSFKKVSKCFMVCIKGL